VEHEGGKLAEYKWPEYPELRVFKLSLKAGEELTLPEMKFCAVLLVLDGQVTANGKALTKHSTWFVMPGSHLALKALEGCTLLVANPCE